MPSEPQSFAQKLWPSASGGFVIGVFLLVWSNLPLAGASKAANALDTFQKNVASPEPFIFVPVVVALFACMALSGSGPVDFLSRWLLRPALIFCADFCVTAAGAILPFGLPWLWSTPTHAAAYMVWIFGVVAGVGWMFHRAVELSQDMSDDTLPRRRRLALNWIGVVGLAVLALVASL